MSIELFDTDTMTPRQLFKQQEDSLVNVIRSFLPAWDLDLLKHAPALILWIFNSRKSKPTLLRDVTWCTILPSRFLESHFGSLYRRPSSQPGMLSGLNRLITQGIIIRSNYSRDRNLSREYSLSPRLFVKIAVAAFNQGINLIGKMKNTVTIGEAMTQPVRLSSSSLVNDPAANIKLSDSSPLMDVIGYQYEDVLVLEKLIEYISEECVTLDKKIRRQGYTVKNQAAASSIMNDFNKGLSMAQRGQKDEITGIFKYQRLWKFARTGRSHEIEGLQGLSRKAKKAIYANVDNLNNYDIRSSQIALLRYLCIPLGIDTEWIDTYTADKEAKHRYAEMLGITVDEWKVTILCVIFGGSDGRYGTPFRTIMKSKKGNKQAANETHAMWLTLTEGLRKTCKAWLTRVREYANMHSVGGVLTNAVGVQLNLITEKVTSKFLSAFLLQGLESKILAELILYKTDDYRVISPEFDGLVVRGVISPEVWTDVLAKCNMSDSNLVLENKPF